MGIAVDAQGIVYVANLGTSQILRFTKEGLSLGIFGQASRAGSGLRLPNDVAIDAGNIPHVEFSCCRPARSQKSAVNQGKRI